MFKKIMLTFIFLTLTTATLAETCPSISQLKENNFHGWEPYNSDSGEPLFPQQLTDFKKDVRQFLMAEWAEGAPEGESHCYYGDKNGNYMDAFLARHGFHDAPSANWHNDGGFMRCKGEAGNCVFVEGGE